MSTDIVREKERDYPEGDLNAAREPRESRVPPAWHTLVNCATAAWLAKLTEPQVRGARASGHIRSTRVRKSNYRIRVSLEDTYAYKQRVEKGMELLHP